MARPVSLLPSGGAPYVSVTDGPPATPVNDGSGPPVTLVTSGAPPICLVDATGTVLGGLAFAGNAWAAWDFINNEARYANNYEGVLANTPGWTFSRASTGYAQNAAGVLLPFASGELRRTDKGVLIEGARTNLLTRSQEFDNAAWALLANGTGVVPTVTANYAAAPDGTTTADRLQFSLGGGTTTSDFSDIYQNNTTTGALTFSVWLKSTDGSSSYNMQLKNPFGSTQNITVTGSWQRFEVTATSSGSVSYTIRLRGGQTPTHPNTADILAWGAQLEAASFPSSYIPTTTASATRAADVLTVPVSGIDYPLSLFAEFERAVDTGSFENLFSVRNSTTDYGLLYVGSSDVGTISAISSSVNQGTSAPAGAISTGTTQKLAGRIATNDMLASRNGILGSTDTGVTLPALNPTTIELGFNGSSPSFGYLRRAAIWNRALSDAELQALTL